MPSDLWEERRGVLTSILDFKRPLKASDFNRFDIYAPRIKALVDNCPEMRAAPSGDLLRALNLYRPSNLLLPNLQHIEYGYLLAGVGDIFWQLFLSTKLRCLNIASDSDETIGSALTHLQHISPPLRTLSVQLQFRAQALSTFAALSEVLPCLTALKTFRLSNHRPLPMAFLAQLASLPCLENLHLWPAYIDIFLFTPTSLASRDRIIFRNLDRFTIRGSSISACTDFVRYSRFPRATRAILDICSRSEDDLDPLPYFEALQDSYTSHTVVAEVSFDDDGFSEDWVAPAMITLDSLRPLFAFCNLQILRVMTPCTLGLDDGALKEIATSWPHLTKLCLMNSLQNPDSCSDITLHGLAHLVRHCPKLQELELLVDASQTDIRMDQRPCGAMFNGKLTFLSLGTSRPGDPTKVALFLSLLFHKLKYILTEHEEGSPDFERWMEAERCLPIFAAVRPEQLVATAQVPDESHT
ncbi:hypothetical protein A0H81_13179 [Grifola frondosa]|uniref:Uncharacterized protein n=1 Tax=Grifola frondosa TaxID=5627 RepID=A0A1C7LSC4_GRIFR|nr:hypothetical protein A0H81_13179 [Grifola frondosa]